MVHEACGRSFEQEFNFNAMVSQRGVLNLCHSDAQYDALARRGNAMRIDGVDAELLDARACAEFIRSSISTMRGFRFAAVCCSGAAAPCAMTRSPGVMRALPTLAASTSSRIARSPASSRDGSVVGVETTRGPIGASKVGLAVAGQHSRLAAMAGLDCRSRATCCRPLSPKASSR